MNASGCIDSTPCNSTPSSLQSAPPTGPDLKEEKLGLLVLAGVVEAEAQGRLPRRRDQRHGEPRLRRRRPLPLRLHQLPALAPAPAPTAPAACPTIAS